jgi:hypothetical protein
MFEIGNSLREARLRQGLEHSQVELATKIRAKYIRALEEEEFDVLPGSTYIKGFMRSYAEFLGLDGQLYVDEYNSRHVVEVDDMPQRRARQNQHRSIERKVVLGALAGIAAVTALVIVAWKFGGGASPSPTTPSTAAKSHVTPPTGLQFVGRHGGTYLVVRRNSSTGAVLFQGTLRPGAKNFLIGKRFWLSVKRATGVRLVLAHKTVSLPAGRNLKLIVTPTKTTRVRG